MVLGLLGVAFSPAWTGAMAAINGHRLGLNMLWRPVVVGVLATLLCFVLPWDLAFIVYAGALVVIWKLDLQSQLEALSGRTSSWNRGLLIPCIAGAPLAILAFLGLFVVPFAGSAEPSSMERYVASYSSNQQTAIQPRPQGTSDPGEMFARLRQREEDQQSRRHKTWAAFGLAKLFSGTGGKALGVLFLGLGAGLFKWFTGKPTSSKGTG